MSDLPADFDLDSMSDADLAALESLLSSVDRDMRFNRLETECWDLSRQYPLGKAPYDWQQEFHAAGADCQRRGMIAANQVGKTSTAARKIAMHQTGRYPPWWTGRWYERPVMVSCATDTNQNCRDITMGELLGDLPQVNTQAFRPGQRSRAGACTCWAR